MHIPGWLIGDSGDADAAEHRMKRGVVELQWRLHVYARLNENVKPFFG